MDKKPLSSEINFFIEHCFSKNQSDALLNTGPFILNIEFFVEDSEVEV